MTQVGFHPRKDNEPGSYESYKGKYVNITKEGISHVGLVMEVTREHILLCPILVSENLPGCPPKQTFRIETETPARINLPVSVIYPSRKEYLDEIVEESIKMNLKENKG